MASQQIHTREANAVQQHDLINFHLIGQQEYMQKELVLGEALIVKYLTKFFLHYMHNNLEQNQTMYVAGGFDEAIRDTCWYVQKSTKPQPEPRYM